MVKKEFTDRLVVIIQVLCVCCLFNYGCAQPGSIGSINKSRYVDPFVCTSGDNGQLSPSATLPFGLVKLGPETDPTNQAGYNYTAKRIKGFTINRMEGVGCKGAGGNILVKPGLGEIDKLSYLYDKTSEKASPGYYAVNFQTPSIRAALTVSNGTGWQKYTYESSGNAWIMVDLSYSLEKLIGEQHEINDNCIEGSIQAYSVCQLSSYKFYYNLEIDRKADSVRVDGSVVWYFFKIDKGQSVNVKTSVSSVSIAQAVIDRDQEIGKADFEAIRNNATVLWNEKLNKISVEGKPEYVKLFYTNYYHSLLSPSNLSGASGNYRGSDGNLYKATGYYHYHGWSIWDNFRTELPLLTITEPAIMNDICRSLIDLYQEGKAPWGTATEPFLTVRTEHAILVLLDCYTKGINKFDLEEVYPFLKKEAEQYPDKSPDQKLETAYDYWALSKIAGLLNKKEDAERFSLQAAKHQDIWREKFLKITDKSDIMHGDGLYEGTLWQYRWFVPYNVKGMMSMLGGKSVFTDQLEYFFNNNLYNHGNEPDIHVPFLFNFTDKPYLSQKIVNHILTKNMEQEYGTHVKWGKPYIGRIYKMDPVGYVPEMDDDAGTMSAWYVLSSIGIYPACVGEPVYSLTSPVFSSVTIQLPGNKTFRITAKNVSDESFYIQKAFLNGKELNRCWIKQDEITMGGTLEFVLGKTPNLSWGTSEQYITQFN